MERDRQTDTDTDRQIDRQTDRETSTRLLPPFTSGSSVQTGQPVSDVEETVPRAAGIFHLLGVDKDGVGAGTSLPEMRLPSPEGPVGGFVLDVISLCRRTYQTKTAMWGDRFYSATITLVPPVTLVLHGLLPLHSLHNIHVLLHNI